MPNAIIVVDMLVGFLEPGHNLYCGDNSRRIIPNVIDLLKRETATGARVLYVADNHELDDLEFEMFPVHCVKGTDETRVIGELSEFDGDYIPKNRYSGFFNTDLEDRLAELRPKKLILVGVCTNICVMHTAADARNRDYAVEIPVDCVASFDEEAHRYALEHARNILGVKLTEPAGP